MTGARATMPQALPGRMGFGVSGPHGTALVSRATTTALIRAAFAGGVCAFDTGPSYGGGEAEKRLGKALAGLDRDRVFLSTKAGIDERKRRDFSPAALRASVQRSLRRLSCDHVDALFLHGPHPLELNDEVLRALEEEKRSGRVRLVGMAGRGSELDAALHTGIFDALMAPVHPTLNPQAMHRLARARAAGLRIFGIESLAGASTGLRWPRSLADLWYGARALRRARLAKPLRTPGEALHYGLVESPADVVMVTTTRMAHLRDALALLDEPGPTA